MQNIPMLDLKAQYQCMKSEIDNAVAACFEQQNWVLGEPVKQFEKAAKDYLQCKSCIGVASGTDALVLSLRALALKRLSQPYFKQQHKIITTAFTFSATGEAILRAGATPIFVDIEPGSFNLSPQKVQGALEKYDDVVGILPVHLYGLSAEMDLLAQLAEAHDCFIVEDTAQAFGATHKDQYCGAIGDAGTFSFYPSKNLGGCGDGGLVATNDEALEEIIRVLAVHGGKDKYNVDYLGYNSRLDTLQAAVLLVKLKYLAQFNDKRREIAKCYNEAFINNTLVQVPHSNNEFQHVFHQYTIRVKNNRRDELQCYLANQGIASVVYYPVPLHKMALFQQDNVIEHLALTETMTASTEVLSLPIEPLQTIEQTARVIEVINRFCEEASA